MVGSPGTVESSHAKRPAETVVALVGWRNDLKNERPNQRSRRTLLRILQTALSTEIICVEFYRLSVV